MKFISEAHRHHKPVFFDTDDLVFDPSAAKYEAILADLDKQAREQHIKNLRRMQRTMRACDAVIVSTEALRQLALTYHNNVFVVPNAVSVGMMRLADEALQAKISAYNNRQHDDTVSIVYFSGTATHKLDFLQAADALLWALDRYPQLVLKIIGPLQLDERFDKFGYRVVHLPLQPWQTVPRIYPSVDINIAPLEPDNPFTESKSCIKYLEAALCKVPTGGKPTH